MPDVRWNLAVAGLASSWGLISLIAAGVHLSAVVLVFARVLIAVVAILVAILVLRRGDLLRVRSQRGWLACASVGLAVHWVTFFAAIKLSSIAVGNLTAYSAPIIIAVVAPLVLSERRSWVAASAILPASIGLALIALTSTGSTHATEAGIAVGLLSAFALAAVLIATKKLADTLHPLTIELWSYVVGALVLLPALPFAGRLEPHGREWLWLVLLGVAFTALPGVVYVRLLRHVTAQSAGALTYLEPVSAAVLGWLVLGQRLSWQIALGGALVLAGGILVVVLEPASAAAIEAAGITVSPSPDGRMA
jgi:drug/metabolite transporter (DMT)-like permease